MSKIRVSQPHLRRTIIRYLSKRSGDDGFSNPSSINENVVLADALNLLSPAKHNEHTQQQRYTADFKPSLYNNLTKGPASEQFKVEDFTHSSSKAYNNGSRDSLKVNELTNKYVNTLLFGIKSSNIINRFNLDLSSMSPKELSNYIKSITEEDKLMELIDLLYSQNKLNIKNLTEIVLNPGFKDFSKCSIDLLNINKNYIKFDSPIHYTQFNIILLKKFYDLKAPLQIIKNLKSNFDKYYFPLIKEKKLAPFYERIVWKFQFQYNRKVQKSNLNELYYMNELNNLQSSFLIWESSSSSSLTSYDINRVIINYMLTEQASKLTALQLLFLKICIQNLNHFEDANTVNTKLLSNLKRISIRYHIYSLHSVNNAHNEENSRLVHYSILNKLEEFILNELIDPVAATSAGGAISEAQSLDNIKLLKEIKSYRESYISSLLNNSNSHDPQTNEQVDKVLAPQPRYSPF
ncbi:hypothetical protein DFJ63DRAFT_334618 [Scheffersomyces coipomensis]|uniref:uncharacterized protein n=1 Tax=Scheffersomyces coipomensis TaxID=1788519 RepID=UPI00315CB86D